MFFKVVLMSSITCMSICQSIKIVFVKSTKNCFYKTGNQLTDACKSDILEKLSFVDDLGVW